MTASLVIMKVYFRGGQLVHEGEALVEIDPRPYEVQLEQTLGQLAKNTAALKNMDWAVAP